jgi:hypothetical protein
MRVSKGGTMGENEGSMIYGVPASYVCPKCGTKTPATEEELLLMEIFAEHSLCDKCAEYKFPAGKAADL